MRCGFRKTFPARRMNIKWETNGFRGATEIWRELMIRVFFLQRRRENVYNRYIIPKTSEQRRPRKGKIDMSECRRDFCFAQKAFPRDQRPRSWAELERCVCCQFACVARSSTNRRFTCHALSFINSSHRPLRIDNPRECDGETTANLHSESNQQLTACINDVTQCYPIRVCGWTWIFQPPQPDASLVAFCFSTPKDIEVSRTLIGSAMEGEVGTHLKQISEATWNENVCANLFALFLCCFAFHVPFPNKGMLTFSLFPCQTKQNTWSMLLGMMRWTWRESDFRVLTAEAQELRNYRA